MKIKERKLDMAWYRILLGELLRKHALRLLLDWRYREEEMFTEEGAG